MIYCPECNIQLVLTVVECPNCELPLSNDGLSLLRNGEVGRSNVEKIINDNTPFMTNPELRDTFKATRLTRVVKLQNSLNEVNEKISRGAIKKTLSTLYIANQVLSGQDVIYGVEKEEASISNAEKLVRNYHGQTDQLFEALQHYKYLYDENPTHVRVLSGISGVLLNLGYQSGYEFDPEAKKEAKFWFEKALKIDKKNPIALRQKANLFFVEGNLKKAVKELKNILKNHPNDFRSQIFLAKIYFQLGSLVDAIPVCYDIMMNVENVTPDEKLAFFSNVGDGFLATKDGFWATTFYCEALMLDPGNPWLWHNCSLAAVGMAGKERVNEGILFAHKFSKRALTHMEFGAARQTLNQMLEFLEEAAGKERIEQIKPMRTHEFHGFVSDMRKRKNYKEILIELNDISVKARKK